jgi:predicted nucleotide-binding protein
MMEMALIEMSLKALAEVARAIVSKKADSRSARSDTLSPDMMEQYNRLVVELHEHHPEAPIIPFKNIENPTQANYPKAIEVLGQIKVGLAMLEKEIAPVPPDVAASKTKRPRVFIGCSVEGLASAKIIQLNLSHNAEPDIWHQGVFGLSAGTLETLTNKVGDYEYAVLVLTPDDLNVKRGVPQLSARDNVLFELGLFMGALGRRKTFIVAEDTVTLPTDLAGITPATYSLKNKANLVSALGPVCTRIELEMGTL